ncbi:MAG: YHS domain-containing (seleno)protein [Candidatus Sumerlaeia bacterium]|nr:YHS domain-containing (seleno)protein [Candidatus Sumerlaeia bacterium]
MRTAAAQLAATLFAAAAPAQFPEGITPPVPTAPYTAVHYPAAADAAGYIARTVNRAAETAGVAHVFVAEGDAAALAAAAAPAGKLASVVAATETAPSRPAVVLYDKAGKELARLEGGDTANLGDTIRRIARDGAAAHQNVAKKGELAISGYDPVSYFDGTPSKGSETITSWYDGATYRFANEGNRAKFAADPVAFAPAYGGWCAYAMVDGEKVDVDPKTYKISEGRLLLFYNGLLGNTLKKWNKADEADQLSKADANWDRTTR